MKILYIGDIMAEPGIKVVEKALPKVRKQYSPDLVIAQAENVSEGKGMTIAEMKRLQKTGIDFFTGGNHTPAKKELDSLLQNSNEPVIGPVNLVGCPGEGYKFFESKEGRVLIVSVMGSKVGKTIETINPLQEIDRVLELNKDEERAATIVNFHGDYSSEKRIFGYYLDGQVSAVIGDHWHVPTNDAMVLPKGTAHITDVGMCGTLHSSLGVTFDSVIPRWRDDLVTKNEIETKGPMQFNAVLVTTDQSGLANSIDQIQIIQ